MPTITKRIEDLERQVEPDEARVDCCGIAARLSQIRAALRNIWSRPPAGLPHPREWEARTDE